MMRLAVLPVFLLIVSSAQAERVYLCTTVAPCASASCLPSLSDFVVVLADDINSMALTYSDTEMTLTFRDRYIGRLDGTLYSQNRFETDQDGELVRVSLDLPLEDGPTNASVHWTSDGKTNSVYGTCPAGQVEP